MMANSGETSYQSLEGLDASRATVRSSETSGMTKVSQDQTDQPSKVKAVVDFSEFNQNYQTYLAGNSVNSKPKTSKSRPSGQWPNSHPSTSKDFHKPRQRNHSDQDWEVLG